MSSRCLQDTISLGNRVLLHWISSCYRHDRESEENKLHFSMLCKPKLWGNKYTVCFLDTITLWQHLQNLFLWKMWMKWPPSLPKTGLCTYWPLSCSKVQSLNSFPWRYNLQTENLELQTIISRVLISLQLLLLWSAPKSALHSP